MRWVVRLVMVMVPLGVLLGWRFARTTPAPEDQPTVAEAPTADPPVVTKSEAPAKPANTLAAPVQPASPVVPVPPAVPTGVAVKPPSVEIPLLPVVPATPPVTPASYSPVVPAGVGVPPPLPNIPSVTPPTRPVPPAVVPPLESKLPPLPAAGPPIPPSDLTLSGLAQERLVDLAGSSKPPKVDIPGVPPTVPAIPSAPPVSKLKPLSAAPDGATVVYLNQSRVAIDYEVTKKGASGLGMVELWVKDANGWSRATTVKAGDPVEVDLPADGAYGAKVVPVSGQGVRGDEPAKDAEPDLWVVRDMTPPEVDLKVASATAGGGLFHLPSEAPFVLELTAKDANLACETLVVEWSADDKPPATLLFTGKDLGKEKIETKIGVFVPRKLAPDKGTVGLKVVLDWTPTSEVPARVNFTVSVKDKAGNLSGAGHANLGTDLTAPAARVTGVRGLSGR
jgi:hypothetical protein